MTYPMRTLATLAALLTLPAGLAAQAADLTGAGATFPYPIYSKWFAELREDRLGAIRLAGGAATQ